MLIPYLDKAPHIKELHFVNAIFSGLQVYVDYNFKLMKQLICIS